MPVSTAHRVVAATFLAAAGTFLMGACQASDTTDPTTSPSASPSGVPSKPPSSVPSAAPTNAPTSAPTTYPTAPPTAQPYDQAYGGTWGGNIASAHNKSREIVEVNLYPLLGTGLVTYTHADGSRCYIKTTLQRNDPHDVVMTEAPEFPDQTAKCGSFGYEVLSLSGNVMHFSLRSTPTASNSEYTGVLSKTSAYHAPGH